MVNVPFCIDNPFDNSTECFFKVFSVAQKSSVFSSVLWIQKKMQIKLNLVPIKMKIYILGSFTNDVC